MPHSGIVEEDLVSPLVRSGVHFSKQLLAVARIRILPVFTNFRSVFSNILVPILLIAFSLFSRQLMLFKSSQQPASFSGGSDFMTTGEFSLESVFPNSNSQVPLRGTWDSLPLPAEFDFVRVSPEESMMDFLWDSDAGQFSFALEPGVVWLDPANPRSALAILAYMHDPAVKVTVKSYANEQMLRFGTTQDLFTLILYTVLSVGAVATQSSGVIFEEHTSLIKKVGQLQGLSPLAYWAGSALGHFVVYVSVVLAAPILAVLSVGKVLTQVPDFLPILFLSSIITTFQLVLLGYGYFYVFRTKRAMLQYSSLFLFVFCESVVLSRLSILFATLESANVWDLLIALIAPPFNVCAVLAELATIHMRRCSLFTESCDFEKDF
jgi:hypothetical protein